MRTEDLARPAQRPDSNGPSAALLEHTPPLWYIIDDRDRSVALSLAGSVLHFSRTYKLCVGPITEDSDAASDECAPLPTLRWTSRPTWIEALAGPPTVTKHGKLLACLSFRVRRQLGWWMVYRWLWEIHTDSFEVETAVMGHTDQQRRLVRCPLVARSRWLLSLVLLAVVGAAAFALGELVVRQGVQVLMALATTGAPSNPWQFSWFWPTLGAVASPVLAFANTLWHLTCRSRALQVEFRQRWPTVAADLP
jgi:hypothetical protein